MCMYAYMHRLTLRVARMTLLGGKFFAISLGSVYLWTKTISIEIHANPSTIIYVVTASHSYQEDELGAPAGCIL